MKTLRLLFMATSLVLVMLGVFFFMSHSGASKAMETLPLGSSYEDLLSLAGSPDYETDGTLWVEPKYKKSPDQIIRGCVKEVWYESWLKFIPSKLSFCFDADNMLVHKYHWSSW